MFTVFLRPWTYPYFHYLGSELYALAFKLLSVTINDTKLHFSKINIFSVNFRILFDIFKPLIVEWELLSSRTLMHSVILCSLSTQRIFVKLDTKYSHLQFNPKSTAILIWKRFNLFYGKCILALVHYLRFMDSK